MSRLLVALVATAVLAAGCAVEGTSPSPSSSARPSPATGADVAGPSAVDVGFSQDMAAHHDQAVQMATLALDRGTPAVRALAQAILVNQSQEVGMMRGWLTLWGESPYAVAPMAWMADHADHADHDMAAPLTSDDMPGMASVAQLERLSSLDGARFDRLFLTLMSRHHRGGIAMAHEAAGSAGLPLVRDTARAMVLGQLQDLQRMRALRS